MKPLKFYFAYGSNLNVAQMARRCPAAKKMQTLMLPGWRLVFRGVADIVPARNAQVAGGLWIITDRCERSLDIYEGVKSGLYTKESFPITYLDTRTGKREITDVLFYRMRSREFAMPSSGYLASIADGYDDFGLDLAYLDAALDYTMEQLPEQEMYP